MLYLILAYCVLSCIFLVVSFIGTLAGASTNDFKYLEMFAIPFLLAVLVIMSPLLFWGWLSSREEHKKSQQKLEANKKRFEDWKNLPR